MRICCLNIVVLNVPCVCGVCVYVMWKCDWENFPHCFMPKGFYFIVNKRICAGTYRHSNGTVTELSSIAFSPEAYGLKKMGLMRYRRRRISLHTCTVKPYTAYFPHQKHFARFHELWTKNFSKTVHSLSLTRQVLLFHTYFWVSVFRVCIYNGSKFRCKTNSQCEQFSFDHFSFCFWM